MTNLVFAQPLDLSSDRTTLQSLRSQFATDQYSKNKLEDKIKSFFKALDIQKEDAFKKLAKDDTESSDFKKYERAIEVYVSFEALNHFVNTPETQRSCSKFKHDYHLSMGEEPTKPDPYQALVLELFEKLCNN